ncbi:MAG: ribonuclease D [Rhodothermales bacterium]
MIDTTEDLAELSERARQSGCVALDTEFVWERTYYPRLGLVQVGWSEDDSFLVDVTAIDDLEPLGRLIEDPDVVKILHDAQQDLTILRRVTGGRPKNIFDTQRAAGFADLRSSISLAGLLRTMLGVDLPKTESRTDWLRRPLSKSQIAYALDDVRHLPALREKLLDRVAEKGHLEWLREEMAAYDDLVLYEEKDPHEQYKRLSGKGRLGPRERAVLRELAAWREEEARLGDRPRGFVAPDAALAQWAKRKPRSEEEVRSMKGFSEKQARRHGAAIAEAVARGLDVPLDEQPRAAGRPEDEDAVDARLYLALSYLKGKCLAEGIDPALVASRADMQAVVAEEVEAATNGHLLLSGWRRDFIGGDLLELLRGERSVEVDPETGLPMLAS